MCDTGSADTSDAKEMDCRCACRCEVRRENAAGRPGDQVTDCCSTEWEALPGAPGGAVPGHGQGVLNIRLHLHHGRGGCCHGREVEPGR